MNTKIIFIPGRFSCALAAISLTLLAGCKREAPAPVSVAPPAAAPAQAPAVVAEPPVVVAGSDYMYYPGYEVYYSPSAQVYWYMQGGAWVSGPVVPGISADVLLGAPSVRMDFHDSPANHHADVVRQYPRDWRPRGR